MLPDIYKHVESKELSLVMTMKGVQISKKDLLLSLNIRGDYPLFKVQAKLCYLTVNVILIQIKTVHHSMFSRRGEGGACSTFDHSC